MKKRYRYNRIVFYLKIETSRVLITFLVTEIKKAQAVFQGQFYMKMSKFRRVSIFNPQPFKY